MIRLSFLLPIIMCAIWWWFLTNRGYTLKEGLRGFLFIIAFNTIIIGFFVIMLFVTNNQ
ncbi:hypothetical protein [Thalassotalea piscium]|uniref:Putative membrane protein n=1 Tax=Thalassotalea piscium TaxID=1230533 RepID=A0A7X0TT88_9GAMM|nr:hypothetical protein [Thalassotalea piscium]MBB6542987.1 putative membrane protein [Thalassotalea piscium]